MKRRVSIVLAGSLTLAACADNIPLPTEGGSLATRRAAAAAAATDEFVAGQIIVRYRAGASRDGVAEKHRAKKKSDLRLERAEILEVAPGDEEAVVAELRADPNVEFAEPDWIQRVGPCETTTTCGLPDGGFWNLKWDYYNTGSFVDPTSLNGGTILTGKNDADIDWAEMYDRLGASFSGSAVIGMLDTGIRPTHVMFTGKIIAGKRFLVDGQPETNYTDDHGHGSHTAGIAAGRWTAAVPGVGYGANIKLLVGKVCNSAGTCPSSGTANAIIWAADNGANVINMSLGSFGGNPDGTGSALQQAAMQYALSKNVLSVCATGNDDGKVNYFGGVGYPARFPECMAVGATDWFDTKASYSNYGPQIAVSAPGGDGEKSPYSLIMSASRSSDISYTWNAGTSMATPQVAGLAAMLYATGLTTPSAVRQRIIETADDIEAPGFDVRTGYGRINAYRAIFRVSPNAPPVANAGGTYAGHKGVPVQFDGSASSDPNAKAITFAWNFGDPTSASNTATTATPSHTYLRAGTYSVSLTVTDASNRANSVTTTVSVPNIVPNVSLGGATILRGETYSASGTFSDADPDSWTASVNYGDDSPDEALTLSGKSFSVSHAYTVAGTRTVSVTVSDDDGGNGVGTATVRVLTSTQGIQELLLNPLGGGFESLNDGRLNALQASLRAAQASLGRGNATAAENEMRAFVNKVQAAVAGGDLSASGGASLISAAERVVASMH